MYISENKLRQISRHLHHGGVIAYPTEAVYGLGCDPLNEKAVLRILNLKQRSIDKGLILIAADLQQIKPYIVADAAMLNKITSSWPGPVTWLIPTQPWVPKWLTGNHHTLAIRITAHPLVRLVSKFFGHPLVSTSANTSGKNPAINALQVRKFFSASDDILVIKSATGGLKQTTPIYNAIDGRCLR